MSIDEKITRADSSAAANVRRLADSQLRHGPYSGFGWGQRDAFLGVWATGDMIGAGVVSCPAASLVFNIN